VEKVLAVEKSVAEKDLDSLWPDSVLNHLDGLQGLVGGVGSGPSLHGSILETITTANNGFERGQAGVGGLESGKVLDGVGDDGSSGGSKSVVVQEKVAERTGLGVEVAENLGETASKRVVREIDGVEFREGEESGKKRGKSIGDFGNQTSSEDVGRVEDLQPAY
jgi:hypothetical protein